MGRGKKTNRNYITRNEWINDFQGKKESDVCKTIRGLPFHFCHLTLKPFETPVCTTGTRSYLFDLEAIAEYIKDYGVHPVTGEPLKFKDLTRLHIHKNSQGKYACPIMDKEFTEHTRIVAVGTTGNVYSWEAVDELNIKRRHWKDLISEEPFKRKDIITVQDPQKPQDIAWPDYYHVKKTKEEAAAAQKEATIKPKPKKPKPSTSYDGGFTCAGFSAAPVKPLTEVEKPGQQVSEKGYAQLTTSLGPLNLELRCDLAPKTCENFIKLCKSDYYKGTIFHRNIPGFMIQGGDPTGTGKGGTSIWKEKFFDEIKPQLLHNKRGVLSMANAGPNTNGSQFFILYAEKTHLNNKHTVFGSVVGGMETLDKMEKIPTGESDKPITDIVITNTTVFKDPFEEAVERKANEHILKKEEEENARMGKWYSNPQGDQSKTFKEGVGKYMDPNKNPLSKRNRGTLNFGSITTEEKSKKIPRNTKFSWT